METPAIQESVVQERAFELVALCGHIAIDMRIFIAHNLLLQESVLPKLDELNVALIGLGVMSGAGDIEIDEGFGLRWAPYNLAVLALHVLAGAADFAGAAVAVAAGQTKLDQAGRMLHRSMLRECLEASRALAARIKQQEQAVA
jgi:hypothetical protein